MVLSAMKSLSVAIHQPEYFPWANLFKKMYCADVFIFLDDVQYVRRSFQNRNKVKTKEASAWLTVPVLRSNRDEKISNIKIDNEKKWKEQHGKLIYDSYHKTEYFSKLRSILDGVFSQEWGFLNELCQDSTIQIAKALGLSIEFMASSDFKETGAASEKILNLCKAVGATEYVTGLGSKSYLEEEDFECANIRIKYISPIHFKYKQLHMSQGFVADLSVLDFLFHNGPDALKEWRE